MTVIKDNFKTPLGRIVRGSLYNPQTKDAEGKPITTKNGEPAVKFFFELAIPKNPGETSWTNTEWGKIIYTIGQQNFPQAVHTSTFAWKIIDGDNSEVRLNSRGKTVRHCDREGYPGNWILRLSSFFPPSLTTDGGKKQLIEKDFINLGDWIEVYAAVLGNTSQQQPGVLLNPLIVNFFGYGERIIIGADPESVGFTSSTQGQPLPPGCSLTPISSGFNPNPPQVQPVAGTPIVPVQAGTPTIAMSVVPPASPYPAILQGPGSIPPVPPIPPAQLPVPPTTPIRKMLPAAAGYTYEQLMASGQWTDASLIQHGLMEPY